MKIGDLAKQCGVAPSAIRYYESKGLLKSIPRKTNGYREYSDDAAILLKIIVIAQQAGFSLDEIKKILPSNFSNWERDKLIGALQKKITGIEILEKQLKKNKTDLKSILKAVEEKPADVPCEDNARRVFKKMSRSS